MPNSHPTYQWSPNARGPVRALSPQLVGERLESIREQHGEGFTPQNIVDDARPADAPLHPVFEWDDAVAAEGFRRHQAGYLVRHVVVVTDETDHNDEHLVTRAFVSVTQSDDDDAQPGGSPVFTSIDAAMKHEQQRAKLLRRALDELESLRRRYRTLEQLASVFAEFDRVRANIAA